MSMAASRSVFIWMFRLLSVQAEVGILATYARRREEDIAIGVRERF